MSKYRRILVPVDGSATSMRGLREAISLARSHHAKLWILHVVDEFQILSSADAAVYFEQMVAALKNGGRRILARAEARASAGRVRASILMPEIVGGRASDEIVRQARKIRADLIVLGTHGRRGLQRLALGSDAEQVIRRAPVPVLVVR